MAQRSQMNAKEKLGREIDLTNASKDELIEHLCKIIEYEVEKGDDADCDLVRECSDWLDELTEDEVTFTPEELERKLAQLKAGSESKKPVKICKKAKLKTFVRVALIAAVIFAISLVSLSAVAVNKGYGSAWEYTISNLGKLLGLNVGEQIGFDGIIFVKYSDSVQYSNMSELLTKENISIIYPKNLQSNIRITEIRMVSETENRYTLYFIFSNSSYIFNVSNYYMNDVSTVDSYQCITIDDLNFYYTKKQTDVFYAVLQYEGFEYTIQTQSYEDLLLIMNSMKG